jgi:hypothetical protein
MGVTAISSKPIQPRSGGFTQSAATNAISTMYATTGTAVASGVRQRCRGVVAPGRPRQVLESQLANPLR